MEEVKAKASATCKRCGDIGIKITDKTYDIKNKKYVDGAGRCWNGRVCPKCHRAEMKNRARKKRDEQTVAPDVTDVQK